MTNEEAREQIKIIKAFMGYDKDNPIVKKAQEALDMAIKALEQQPLHGYKIDMFTPTAQAWLSTFNTDSATECFTAVQELKEKLNGQMD